MRTCGVCGEWLGSCAWFSKKDTDKMGRMLDKLRDANDRGELVRFCSESHRDQHDGNAK
jgi:hypothetical protein